MPQLLPTQTKTLELLTHLTSYSDLMVLVSGPQGAGKTTLAQALFSSREGSDCLYIKASVMLGTTGVLAALAEHLGLDAIEEDTPESREMIRAESQLRFKDENNFLVIIDQADQLEADALNDLAHFALLLQDSLSFALFGVSGYEREVKQSPAQAPVYVQILEPLSASEAEELLTWAYGVDGHCPFNENTMERLQESSGNWPGPLLAQAEKAMGVTDSSTVISPPARQASSKRMVALLVVASMAVAIAVVYRLHGPELVDQLQAALESPATEDSAAQASAVNEVAVTTDTLADDVTADAPETHALPSTPVVAVTGTIPAEPTSTETAVEETAVDANQERGGVPAEAVQNETVLAESVQTEVTPAPAVESLETSVASGSTAAAASESVTESSDAEVRDAEQAVTDTAIDAESMAEADAAEVAHSNVQSDGAPATVNALASTEDQTLLATTPEPATVEKETPQPAIPAPSVSPYSDDEAALLAAQDGYIVQLLGTHSKASADAFRSEWQDQIPLYLYRSSYNERDWFVATTGIFSDPFSAQEALEGLPEQLRSQSPWIRPLSQVKAAIR